MNEQQLEDYEEKKQLKRKDFFKCLILTNRINFCHLHNCFISILVQSKQKKMQA